MTNPQEIELTTKDLPLHCPTNEMALWSSHPRVYLDIATTGKVICPYCGVMYVLKNNEARDHH